MERGSKRGWPEDGERVARRCGDCGVLKIDGECGCVTPEGPFFLCVECAKLVEGNGTICARCWSEAYSEALSEQWARWEDEDELDFIRRHGPTAPACPYCIADDAT